MKTITGLLSLAVALSFASPLAQAGDGFMKADQSCMKIKPASHVNIPESDAAKMALALKQAFAAFHPDEVFYGNSGDDHGQDWQTRLLVHAVRYDGGNQFIEVHGNAIGPVGGQMKSIFPNAQPFSDKKAELDRDCTCFFRLAELAAASAIPGGTTLAAIYHSSKLAGFSEKNGSTQISCYFGTDRIVQQAKALLDRMKVK